MQWKVKLKIIQWIKSRTFLMLDADRAFSSSLVKSGFENLVMQVNALY